MALGLLFEDVYSYFDGKDSITGHIVNAFKKAIAWVKEMWNEFFVWISEKVQSALGWARGLTKYSDMFTKYGNITGMTPATAPVSSTSNRTSQNWNISAPITVSVPPGTDPSQVGERVEGGVAMGFDEFLSRAGRHNSPSKRY